MSKITLVVDSVCVEYSNSRAKVEVELCGVDIDDVMSELNDDDDAILSRIDEDKIREYLESKGYKVTDDE